MSECVCVGGGVLGKMNGLLGEGVYQYDVGKR